MGRKLLLTSDDCSIVISFHVGKVGEEMFTGVCARCGVPVWASTLQDAEALFVAHETIPAPPAVVLARPVTVADVDTYPEWFLNGRGHPVAAAVKCQHGYSLVAFCPHCI